MTDGKEKKTGFIPPRVLYEEILVIVEILPFQSSRCLDKLDLRQSVCVHARNNRVAPLRKAITMDGKELGSTVCQSFLQQ
jgi:hypothetical protein